MADLNRLDPAANQTKQCCLPPWTRQEQQALVPPLHLCPETTSLAAQCQEETLHRQ